MFQHKEESTSDVYSILLSHIKLIFHKIFASPPPKKKKKYLSGTEKKAKKNLDPLNLEKSDYRLDLKIV